MLRDKVIFVTGCASGIGQAAALLFAEEGASLALADRNESAGRELEETVRRKGGRAQFISLDVTSEQAVEAAVRAAVLEFGRLDGAFNNAGVAGAGKETSTNKTADLHESAWRAILDVNLDGVWRCMKHEIQAMLVVGKGSIVNTASVAAAVGIPGQSAYVASKHGVAGITKAAAIEYASRGIRINALCPGFVVTPMTQTVLEKAGETLLARVPMRRYGHPREIAEAAAWLLSDRASFVTGSLLVADGGFTAM